MITRCAKCGILMLNKKDDDDWFHNDLFQEWRDIPLTRSKVIVPKVCKKCMKEYNSMIENTNKLIRLWLNKQ